MSSPGMLSLRQSLSLAQDSPIRPDWLASPRIINTHCFLPEFWNSGPTDCEPGTFPTELSPNPGFVFDSSTVQRSVAFNGMSCSNGMCRRGCLHSYKELDKAEAIERRLVESRLLSFEIRMRDRTTEK